MVELLDQLMPGAERLVDAGHFQADDAAADDEQLLRHVLQQQRVGRIHHARVFPREPRQLYRLRSRRDDRLLEMDELVAVGCFDFDLVRRNELAGTLHDGDLALLGHAGEAAGELCDDLVLESGELADVDFRRAEIDADLARVRGLVDHLGRMQQRLRRNAADVEADAAEGRVALDQHCVHTEVGTAERGRVAAGTGAEHDDLAFDVGLAAGCARSFRRFILHLSPRERSRRRRG